MRGSPQGSAFLAVDKIDFEVKRGEIFALLDPNGTGRETGYVPDEPSFQPFLRTGEFIRFQGEMHVLDAGYYAAMS